MYKTEHFEFHELVPPNMYPSEAWHIFDDRLLFTLDRLRKRYGPITVNDWKWGGDRQWSGIRNPASPDYSPTSQHTGGRAADCLFSDTDVYKVRDDISLNPSAHEFEYITAVEIGVSWLHFDVRNWDKARDGILWFEK